MTDASANHLQQPAGRALAGATELRRMKELLLWIKESDGTRYEGDLGKVIHRSGGFVFDCDTDEGLYTVTLQPQRVSYRLTGQSTIPQSPEKCEIAADLYHNESGVLLFGNWVEKGETYKWIAVLPKEKIKPPG